MNDIVLATSAADAEAVAAVERHHAELAGSLVALAERVIGSAAGGSASAEAARRDLVDWCESELVPHALAEEKGMYPAAHATTEGRLLVDSMLAEHVVIVDLVREVAEASTAVGAAAAARALVVVFASHLAKENELVLPLLAAHPDVSVAGLLDGMHELLGGHGASEAAEASEGGCGSHTCGCGEVDAPGHPVLDARAVPHSIRHATIFGALDSVRPGEGLVLVAPHDPLPLLAQVHDRFSGAFETEYLERGPEAWRLVFLRRAA
ncbi:MAG TPA: DUF2249 domain-containing protein [Marmoricola sp.]|nr:DUF2249 domain-containing protein [Marmoricola sp.]